MGVTGGGGSWGETQPGVSLIDCYSLDQTLEIHGAANTKQTSNRVCVMGRDPWGGCHGGDPGGGVMGGVLGGGVMGGVTAGGGEGGQLVSSVRSF